MRKTFLSLLLLVFVAWARPASADPVAIRGGAFVLDIEGDMFSFHGDGFSLTTTSIGIYANKVLPGRCDPSGWPFGFCAEAEGDLVDWSVHTTGGEQLLGRGDVVMDGASATDVDFVGSIAIDMVPTPLSSGGTTDFDFVAPFVFQAAIRGVRRGEELFSRQFSGSGVVRVNYEGTLEPGVFAAADETIPYEFAAAETPEPGTLLLFISGLAAAIGRRSAQSTAKQ